MISSSTPNYTLKTHCKKDLDLVDNFLFTTAGKKTSHTGFKRVSTNVKMTRGKVGRGNERLLFVALYGKRVSQNGLVPIGRLPCSIFTCYQNLAPHKWLIDVQKLMLGRGMMARRRVWGMTPYIGQESVGFEVVDLGKRVLALKW